MVRLSTGSVLLDGQTELQNNDKHRLKIFIYMKYTSLSVKVSFSDFSLTKILLIDEH